MSSLSDPPKQSFRLSMLLNDTRYRSATIQVIAMIGFMLAAAWLVNNTMQNLANLGKPANFGFLTEPASYDINQRLIKYDSRDPHLRAALVGLLNTLVVAALGCVTATFLGVVIGVLRLSRNWLISRLMTIYVEMFRNVPVLLWIVFVMAILIESLPAPRMFRGEDPEASMALFGSVAVTNQGVFLPRMMMTEWSWLLALVLAVSIAVVVGISKRASRIQEQTGDRPKTLWQSLGILIIPVLMVFIVLSIFTRNTNQTLLVAGLSETGSLAAASEEAGRFDLCYPTGSASSLSAREFLEAEEINFRRKGYFSKAAAKREFATGNCNLLVVPESSASDVAAEMKAAMGGETEVTALPVTFSEGNAIRLESPFLPEKGIPRFVGGTLVRNSLIALWLALSLYTAAFVAEIVRSGIMAISKGQTEAASALGLRPNRIMSLVILPQALRVIIPPLISQYLNLTKNSSLAIAVGYMDITGTLGGITMNQTGRELECVLLLMLIYLTISLSISAVMNWYNESVKLKER